MRIVIQAVIDHPQAKRQTVEIGVLERAADAAPSSGLGLLLAESRDLLAALQAVVIVEQTKEVVKTMSRCASCLEPLAVKDTKNIVYRTAFGKASLPSPRLYTRCAGCGAVAHHRDSFSPLALALPERTHPQWRERAKPGASLRGKIASRTKRGAHWAPRMPLVFAPGFARSRHDLRSPTPDPTTLVLGAVRVA